MKSKSEITRILFLTHPHHWAFQKIALPATSTVPPRCGVIHHCDPRQPCPAPQVVFVLGGPGAGKGTMCELAAEQLGWVHLSVGGLLRAAQHAGDPAASEIEETMNGGRLVPDPILMTLLRETTERSEILLVLRPYPREA